MSAASEPVESNPESLVIRTTELVDGPKGQRITLRKRIVRFPDKSNLLVRAALLEPVGSKSHLIKHTLVLTRPGMKTTRIWYEREIF